MSSSKTTIRHSKGNIHMTKWRELTPDEQAEQDIRQVFQYLLGDAWNPEENEHLQDTPKRWIKMMKELTDNESDAFIFTTFENDLPRSEMVIVGPIRFNSLCAHHVIPFMGKAWIAYIPETKIAGLSKLARTVKWFSKGLWTQESLTSEIATFLEEQLNPKGVAVLMKAEHLCMTLRGVKEQEALTTTTSLRGVFLKPMPGADPRQEFFDAIR